METTPAWSAAWDETPRQVGVAPRAIAAIIDAILSGLVIALPLALLAGPRSHETVVKIDGNGNPLGATTTTYLHLDSGAFVLWVALTLGYFIAFETAFGGTIGKLVLGLRVRYRDGSPVAIDAALVRNLLRLVDCFPYFIPYLLGAVFIWTGNERQRLGDKLAETIVTWR